MFEPVYTCFIYLLFGLFSFSCLVFGVGDQPEQTRWEQEQKPFRAFAAFSISGVLLFYFPVG